MARALVPAMTESYVADIDGPGILGERKVNSNGRLRVALLPHPGTGSTGRWAP